MIKLVSVGEKIEWSKLHGSLARVEMFDVSRVWSFTGPSKKAIKDSIKHDLGIQPNLWRWRRFTGSD